jgi:hypothetical protein
MSKSMFFEVDENAALKVAETFSEYRSKVADV